MRAQRRVQVMHQADIRRVVQAFTLAQEAALGHERLDMLVAFLGDVHLLGLLIDGVVAGRIFLRLALQARHELIDAQVKFGALLRGTGNDERRARLVDQDRVHLVDDRIGDAALHAILQAVGKVVAQIIEAELIIGAVGDVAGVGRALLIGGLRILDDADAHP